MGSLKSARPRSINPVKSGAMKNTTPAPNKKRVPIIKPLLKPGEAFKIKTPDGANNWIISGSLEKRNLWLLEATRWNAFYLISEHVINQFLSDPADL